MILKGLVFLLLVLFSNSRSALANALLVCPSSPGTTLLRIKEQMGGDSWRIEGWDPSTDYCTWQGVTCNLSKSVITLDLRNVGAIGPISQYVACLQKLQALYLSQNDISSHLSTNVCKLKNLKYLQIEESGLTGNIPSCLCNVSSLMYVYLGKNEFTGTIPKCIGKLPGLRELYLDCNKLTGTIPQELTQSTVLEELRLDCNPELTCPSSIVAPIFQCFYNRCASCPIRHTACPDIHEMTGCGLFKKREPQSK